MLSADPDRDQGRVALAPGLDIWRQVTVTARDYKGYNVVVRVRAGEGRLRATEVRVTQRDGGKEVTGEALRTITVAAFVRYSLSASAKLRDAAEEDVPTLVYGLLDVADRDRLRAAGPIPETLEWVARIYQLAFALGERPTKQVEEVFEVPRYTASRWVASARARGLLGPTEPGKAGA